MIDEYILNYILLFIFLELIEISWQKAPTMMGMLLRMQPYYEKNIFLFLLMHPTFYFAIGFMMITNYSTSSLILVLIKAADIITKISLIQQVFVKRELSQELTLVLLAPINGFLPYIGLVLYPFLIIGAF